MNYSELVKSDAFRKYFGKRYEKWEPELQALINKKSIHQDNIEDAQAEKKLMVTIKFSWLGFLFTFYWAAYHNAKGWLVTVSIFSAVNFLDTFVLGEVIPGVVFTVVPAMLYAMYGKSYIVAAKAAEMSKTGNLTPPSWSRAVQAVAIFAAPILIGVLLMESTL